MKVRLLRKILLPLFAAIGFLLMPGVSSSAHAESFLFYYNNDDVAQINRALGGTGVFNSVEGLRGTSVWMKDALGEDKPVGFTFERVDQPTRQLVYEYEYACKAPDLQLTLKFKLAAFVGPLSPGPTNAWDSKNPLPGQLRVVSPVASPSIPAAKIPSSCLPSGISLIDTEKNVSFANYQKTNKNNWPGVKSSTQLSVDQTAEQNRDTGSDEPEAECTAPGFGWFVCGAIKYFKAFTEWVEDSLITPMFETKPLSFDADESTNPLYAAWNATRAIANVFFVLVFIAVIFANLFGMEAYNVKKILPKLVVAAILIQASYFMMAIGIDITNILGKGLREIMASVTPAVDYKGGTLGGFVTLGAGALIAAALTAKIAAVGIIAGALPLAIGLAAVMITLVLRQTLIVLAIITAPLAIVSMVLPNTERFFRSWMNLFIKLLLMYPMIVFLFAAGRLAAYATLSNNTALSAVSPIVAMLCMALPLLAVPFTFSWAGGLMQKVSGGVFKGGAKVQGGLDNKLKGRREETRRKATLNANPNLSGWNRLSPRQRWRNKVAGGGFLYNSAAAKRKIGEGQEKILGQDEKSYSRLYDNLARGMDDKGKTTLLESIASGDAKSFGFRDEQPAVNFAINKLAQTRKFETIRKLQKAKDTSKIDAAVSNSFGDIHKAAPDITVGNSAIDSLSASGLKDLHHSTIEQYLDGSAGRGEHVGQMLVDTMNDKDLRNNFNGDLLYRLRDKASRGELGATQSAEIMRRTQVTPGTTVARFI